MKKSDKKLLVMIGFVVLCFVVFFVVRTFFNPTDETVTIDELHRMNIEGEAGEPNYVYNGFSFVKFENLWYTQVKVKDSLIDIPLHFGPKELEDVQVSGSIDDSFKKSHVYITFDPLGQGMQYVALSSAELSLNLVRGIGITPIAACDRNETYACADRPIKTCDNEDAIIYLEQSNETEVVLQGNCVRIKGSNWDLVRATDRLLLQWYGVMK